MNKRGQVSLGLAIIVALVIFLMGIPIVNILKPDVDIARGATGLDCTNSSITDGTRLSCLAVDLVIPYFILIIMSAAGGMIVARFLI